MMALSIEAVLQSFTFSRLLLCSFALHVLRLFPHFLRCYSHRHALAIAFV